MRRGRAPRVAGYDGVSKVFGFPCSFSRTTDIWAKLGRREDACDVGDIGDVGDVCDVLAKIHEQERMLVVMGWVNNIYM